MKLKPCPFCGGDRIEMNAYNISPECYVLCLECGASIEKEVYWGDMSVEEHDEKCWEVLSEAWNRRANDDRP